MAYFKDLTSYEYYPGEPETLAVGWLSQEHEFKRGSVPIAFVDELQRFYMNKLEVITRGHHVCEFCTPPADIVSMDNRYIDVWEYFRSGNGEIRVRSENGTLYSAPALLLHYISEHQYQPPQEFINAVLYQRSIRPLNVGKIEKRE
jgi:hypothetical protein